MTRTVTRRTDLTNKASEVTERAAAKLAKRGLVAAPRPEIEIPTLPVLTDLDDASLIGIYTELVAWADYASSQLSYAQIDERALTNMLEFHEASAMVRGWGDKDKVTIARAARDLDDDVQELKQTLLDAYAVRKLAETVFNNLERDAALVSRELTRRTAGQTPTNRANRWRP